MVSRLLDVDRLRQRLAAAATCAALPVAAGCATDSGPDPASKGGKSASTLITRDVSGELCETWMKGRTDRWCTSPEDARRLASQGSEELGCPLTLDTVKAQRERSFKRSQSSRQGKVVLLTANAATASQDCGKATCCYLWVYDQPAYRHRYIPGRPLTDDRGVARCAPVVADGGATAAPWLVDVAVDTGGLAPAASALALARWLEAAQYEHASIASFARAADELRAVGAPAELVEACGEAAVDEARHAALCFSVATALGEGRWFGPGAMPTEEPRGGGLAELAVAVFVEGCVGESTAALEATRASQAASAGGNEAIARVLASIAADEEAHAALAWRTVAWAIEAGGAPVRTALRGALEHNRPASEVVPTVYASTTARELGCLTEGDRHRVAADAWSGVVVPLAEQLFLAA